MFRPAHPPKTKYSPEQGPSQSRKHMKINFQLHTLIKGQGHVQGVSLENKLKLSKTLGQDGTGVHRHCPYMPRFPSDFLGILFRFTPTTKLGQRLIRWLYPPVPSTISIGKIRSDTVRLDGIASCPLRCGKAFAISWTTNHKSSPRFG